MSCIKNATAEIPRTCKVSKAASIRRLTVSTFESVAIDSAEEPSACKNLQIYHTPKNVLIITYKSINITS